ncbi:MAG: 3-hydroxyacyl-ACP dehydratase FabZ [Rickettsiales bacterium]|jgi:3-hydroxyacyl-[acyl-carrier-protein] dehydratase|nr:3-hydroxyacyl-ACP dehydratase FabZ [Rickettsiales bacterium]
MIDTKGVEAVIPHRGDMRMVDEIREFTDTSAVGIKYVRPDEFWCAGHFPGNPIMPGVLQIEALAQTACFMVFKVLGESRADRLGYFTTMEKIKFSHIVQPGDKLELHVEILAKKMNFYKFYGIAMVSGKKVSEATFSAIMS